jgi:vitamin B12 transporter
MGGVINIITIKKQKTGVHFGGSVSNTSYVPGRYNKLGGAIGEADFSQLVDTQMLNFSLGYGAEKFSFKANWFGNHASNQYLYRDYGGFARRKESNAVLDTGGGVSFVWDLPNLVKLFSTTNFYYADRQYPVTGTSAGFAKEYDFSAKQSLMLDAPLAFRDDLSTELSLTYTFAQMKYGAASRSDDGYVTAVNRWNWYQGDKFTLRAGLDLRVINVDSTEDGVRSGGTGGIFAAAEWMPSKRLMVIASVKEASDFRQAVAVPKAGFVWRINDNLSLKNNYFRSFKFPDFDDMFYHSADGLYAGNPDLKPEDGLGADFGMEFSGEGVFGVSGAAYVQYTTDSIHWVKRAGRWMPQNAGTGFFTGAELRPSLTFNFQDGAKSGGFITVNKIKVSPTYQFQLSWLLNEGLGFDNGMRIPYMPTHIIGCSFDIQFEAGAKKEAGSLLVSAHWESRRYADTQNIMELPPYCLVNITLNQNIGSRFTAFFIVRNVLNQLYTSFAEYPMPGMSITAGLRVNL